MHYVLNSLDLNECFQSLFTKLIRVRENQNSLGVNSLGSKMYLEVSLKIK